MFELESFKVKILKRNLSQFDDPESFGNSFHSTNLPRKFSGHCVLNSVTYERHETGARCQKFESSFLCALKTFKISSYLIQVTSGSHKCNLDFFELIDADKEASIAPFHWRFPRPLWPISQIVFGW